jgi:hypothetical protein
MDRWAEKALRREVHGRTCDEIQEVVDILLVRWLQAHPDIRVAFEGKEASGWMDAPDEFLCHIKAEAWAEFKGQRRCFPRGWGKAEPTRGALDRRAAFVLRRIQGLQEN